jgi:8-amino-7-oxononanoate synthase
MMFLKHSPSVPRQNVFALRDHTHPSLSRRDRGSPNTIHYLNGRRSVHSGYKLTRKLQSTLENRRQKGRLIEPANPQAVARMVDFGSNDTLSLTSSGVLRKAFLDEIARHPDFEVGSRSTRIFEGSTKYLLDLEDHMAQFHRAESALFLPSGYEANVAIWSTVPQHGDVVVYDEYIHASIHDGMRQGRATTRMFSHNSCESLRQCLLDISQSKPAVIYGENTVFIALESVYSMDGDVAPVHEMLKLTKEILPHGNAVFTIDEAHSNGLIGDNGSGFVCHYGLEKEFPIRLQTCGKGLGSTGGSSVSKTLLALKF